MPKKRFSPEQIIGKLREAEVLLAQGKTTAEVSRSLGVTEHTYYRWRKEYGGMGTQLQARDLGPADATLGELLLLPHRRARALVERVHRALLVGDVEVLVVDRDADEARDVARPGRRAAATRGALPLAGGTQP